MILLRFLKHLIFYILSEMKIMMFFYYYYYYELYSNIFHFKHEKKVIHYKIKAILINVSR